MIKRALSVFALAMAVLALPLCVQAAGQYGGVLKIGSQPVNNLDPHFATSIADIMLLEQVYHHLTYIDASNRPVADLATKWDSPDGKIWTFTLRPGVKFNNGAAVTAKDVVYSFNRLRDPKVGTPVVKLYKNIVKVEATDASQVRFTLEHPNPEFASDVGDYHACIIPEGLKDPAKKRIGSGPFMIASYFPEDRIILKKNPHFSQKDAAGNRLPYLDEVHMIFSPDMGGQVEALRGGELNFVGGLTTEFAETVKKSGSGKVLTNDSNMHWVIHMRSDKGHIAADNRIRQALKLATNHRQIINAVRPGLAVVGNGFSPVGPAYGKYYLDKPPVMDLQKARKLLAAAGHPNGLKINLVAQNQLDVIPIATVWKEQLAKIGVTVNIQVVPSDVYFGDGAQSWLKCDFGITDWGARATPVTYFNLAYTSKGPWNESHWSDAEFDRLTSQVDREMDFDKRVQLYHQLQQIMIERGPIVVAYFEKSIAGVSAKVENVKLAADWARTRFWNAYFKK